MKSLFPALLILSLILAGCTPGLSAASTALATGTAPLPQSSQTQILASPSQPATTATVTRTPRPTATTIPTITPTSTSAPTATPNPTIYNPAAFGDIRKVDSFVVTTVWNKTGQDYLYNDQRRYEYSRSPAAFHTFSNFKDLTTSTSGDTFWLGDWNYSKDNLSGDWVVRKVDPKNFNTFPLGDFDLGKTISISNFKSATYKGIEQYKGIPAYHYTFDETNLIKIDGWNVEKVSGELYVSVENRYPLHSYARFSGKIIRVSGATTTWAEGIDERTQDLVSFNQPVKISLPADYPNLDLNLDLPLPPGSVLDAVVQRVKGEKTYSYVTPVNEAEFRAFYTALTPTNGWSVQKLVDVKGPVFWCTACPNLSKEKQQVVLEFREEELNFKHKDYVILVHFSSPL
jgi:hypothetical protein